MGRKKNKKPSIFSKPDLIYELKEEEKKFEQEKLKIKKIPETQRREIIEYLKIKFQRKQCKAPAGYYNLAKRNPDLITQLKIETYQELRNSELEEMRARSTEELRNHVRIQKEGLKRLEKVNKRLERLKENAQFPCMSRLDDSGKKHFHYSYLTLIRQIIGKMGGTFDDDRHYEYRELAGIHKMVREGNHSCKEIYWELESAIGMIKRIQKKLIKEHMLVCLDKDGFPGTEDQRREEAAMLGYLIDDIDKMIEIGERQKRKTLGWGK